MLPVYQATHHRAAVKIVNAQGQTLEGAKVYLFRSEVFFNTRTNIFAEGVTNSEGIIVFENLDAENYFVYAIHEQGGRVSDNGEKGYFIANPLIGNSITYLNIPLEDARPVRPSRVVLDRIFITYGQEFLNGFADNEYQILVRDNNGVILGNAESSIGYSTASETSSFIFLEKAGAPGTPLVIDIANTEEFFLDIIAIGSPSNAVTTIFSSDIVLLTRELNITSPNGSFGLRCLAYPQAARYSFSGSGFADVYLKWE